MNLTPFYKQNYEQRLAMLKEKLGLTDVDEALITGKTATLGNQTIENYLMDFSIPEGVAVNFKINGKEKVVPMATEEPSVIAAASNGAKIIAAGGGIQASTTERLMMGQVLMANVQKPVQLTQRLLQYKPEILQTANDAHPSIVKRGGGAKKIRVRKLAHQFISLDIFIDTKEAMGANMINAMLEAVAKLLQVKLGQTSLMAILSNLADECLATATCRIPVKVLTTKQLNGKELAQRIVLASEAAQVDPYRAATHNKGIMNGIDVVVMASGNDWRAIESSVHAYAARDGHYRGLSCWQIENDFLIGNLTLPLPVGFVGGSIKLNQKAQLNHRILQVSTAKELEEVLVSVGLAQNLAALKALVSEGIQRGHMHLQAKSLLLSVGATTAELADAQAKLESAPVMDQQTARQILKELRGENNE
ncbi:hydroxymethylglutaryl-CoA reductase, degradative [Pediococcus ethanolidurans]|uniref:hydroxymethylglutaryl-CoA reductase, degradative n=1 Tax=Pediococcus ethanolidurans TaxID=319653 RepID=UPI001C1F19CF|nr:hydroxymethylglutaryl-CoA reductase, degradative [Pediococcus ethanolidurans]MBU7555144.1 hydroxymethylglutaryl-CoA reductase, degradative [Pediococcus ethanolidurans]MCV3321570.1 hydroxymethylglutaryl-CoA reductase, degradative [Pediococcus ethanolidurans]MCV3323790.1 hydroxymethylglutaryl-CoA reductase, degradative [Pediococcus ethanolidurans]MCV3555219.1 hydroxymethylglutaryl-CoA reductase, degradative [Pediococcus ethanolidurans]